MKIQETELLSLCARRLFTHSICLLAVLSICAFVWADWPGVGENLPICVASGEQYIPQIVSDGHDGCVIIWYDARDGMELINVYGQRVSAEGDTLWQSQGVQLTDVVSYTWVSYLVACADNNDGAFFAWEDPRNGDFDVYVQHVDGNGSPVWDDNGIRLSMTTNDDFVMDVVADDRGGCIVSWTTPGATEYVSAQRISAAGVKLWNAAGVAVSTGTDIGYNAQMASDGYGGIVACWLDGRYHPTWNDFKDIYAQRIDSLGNMCWADTGVALLKLGSAPWYAFPELVSNGTGRFFVAWYDWRSTDFDIYAQCLSLAGEVLWTANGAVVCSRQFEQTDPRIVANNVNGLFCAWRDNYTSIYAQRLDANGNGLWQSGGVVVASGANEVIPSNAVGTSNGLYGVVYGESDYTDVLVKAQALDNAGNLKWSAGGEPISTVISPKYEISAIADTCGGVIAVWEDDRNGSYAYDIYAQRVDPPVGVSEARFPAKTTTALRCAPNPSHNSTIVAYGIGRKAFVNLCVYDIKGSVVTNLSSGIREPGRYELTWDAIDKHGVKLPSGVYFISLKIDNTERTVQKVILLQ